ncbi:MAG TPA: hypothetical protein ENI48_10350 [Thioploca sp.]|nr:hypothetical protein [Thioploca sp.]
MLEDGHGSVDFSSTSFRYVVAQHSKVPFDVPEYFSHYESIKGACQDKLYERRRIHPKMVIINISFSLLSTTNYVDKRIRHFEL